MAVQAPGVVAGALFGGIGVDLTADGVDLPGQVSGGAPVRALKGEVFNKMGRAVFCGALVAGAAPTKNPRAAERAPGMYSVKSRAPLERVMVRYMAVSSL